MKVLIGIIVTLILVFGWWLPNVGVWDRCGASPSYALIRGVFEKPDLFTCAALLSNR